LPPMLITAPEMVEAVPAPEEPLPPNAYVVAAAGVGALDAPIPLATYAPTPVFNGDTTTPPLFTLTTSPLVVKAPDPGERVVPPIATELPLAVNVSVPMVNVA
jgi:hypothetical protein